MIPDSTLAVFIDKPRDEVNRKAKNSTGIVLHTTGANKNDVAAYVKDRTRTRANVDRRKIDYYDNPGANYPHYLIPWEWRPPPIAFQVAPESDRAWHAGLGAASLSLYDNGSWMRHHVEGGQLVALEVPYAGYASWRQRWPNVASPVAILAWHRTRDPNQFIGIEMTQPVNTETSIPIADEQHSSCARLVVDIARRHGIDADLTRQMFARKDGGAGWPPVVMAHSDTDPLRRTTKNGGWDPGDSGNFRWDLFWSCVATWLKPANPTSGLAEAL